jgi:hypothetical protein
VSAKPGSRSTVTRFCSHETPVHEQGVGSEVFQRRVRPSTAERRVSRAEWSAERSGFERGRESSNRKR